VSEQPPIDGPDDPTDDTTSDSTDGVVDSTEVVLDAGPVVPVTDRIELVDLNTEMQRSYIDYAMAVIVSRALPDVRDGLKPVHRRVIYGMYDGGYRPDRGYN
jgi:DNA gyrase subunit A